MEPSAAIAIIESDLRFLVANEYPAKLGPEWLHQVLSAETVEALQARCDEEVKRRAPFVVTQELLAYTHLYELRNALRHHWEYFSEALGKQKEFDVHLDQVEDFRNAPAHSRELLPHERALLEGIAGVIRTKVTIYRSSKDSDLKHYPVIESIRDSFGNIAADLDPSIGQLVVTNLRLTVGQVVTFEARGWDAQERELTWTACTFGRDKVEHHGSEIILQWAPDEENVGLNCFVEIELQSAGRYHRHLKYDQRVTYKYTVVPPETA
jgi:hypothetical protein